MKILRNLDSPHPSTAANLLRTLVLCCKPSTVHKSGLLILTLLLLMPFLPTEQSDAAPQPPTYKAATMRWRADAGGFSGWIGVGVSMGADKSLRLDPKSAQQGTDPYRPRTYNGRNFYNGGKYITGETISQVIESPFGFSQAIPSWNADTPPGTWIEVQLRARIGTRWTRWYNLGVWASGKEAVERHSVNGQSDTDGRVDTDILLMGTRQKPLTASAFQMKVRLFSTGPETTPRLWGAAVAVSTDPIRPGASVPGKREYWGKALPVSQCSQMVYKDGGEVWCSPTSISMAVGYWKLDTGACETRVRAAVDGVYDWVYKGHGNWPFNTAYLSAAAGLESYVTRFTSLADAEPWIASGVPIAVSLGWGKGQLTGAPIPQSSGHIALLVGFDPSGNPVIHDPAAAKDAQVRRSYPRAEWERLWLEHSGGTAYIAYPPGWPTPKR